MENPMIVNTVNMIRHGFSIVPGIQERMKNRMKYKLHEDVSV